MGGQEWFRLGAWKKKYMKDSGVKVRSGRGLRYLILKGGEPIRGVEWRVGLTSTPHLDTRRIEVKLRSGESILNARE